MREFADDENLVGFSSFAHYVGLTRCLDTVFSNGRSFDPEQATQLAANFDASVMGWYSLLPPSKRELLRGGEILDEQLFRANMLLNM